MAKQRQSGASVKPRTNKSQAIRDYRHAHPSHKPAKIAESLGKQGIKVSAQFVSTILSNSKKRKTIRKPGRPKGSESVQKAPAARKVPSGEISFGALLKVKQIVIEMGGISKAKAALHALEQLLD